MNRLIDAGLIELSMHDKTIRRFEGQYPVPQGVTYNTWLLTGEKTVLFDTVDAAYAAPWLTELKAILSDKPLDALVISHMEPDHSGAIGMLLEAYPNLELIGNAKTFAMLDQFVQTEHKENRILVKDGETLEYGGHSLQFVFAPMVHWPEVMTCFEPQTGTLFSADAFGTFGGAEQAADWAPEARRYYANIVGKYGVQVQGLLRKAGTLPIRRICPLHGPVLEGEALERALQLYGTWAAWRPESEGTLIVSAGFHGHTRSAAEEAQKAVLALGQEAMLIDLAQEDASYAVGEAFRFRRIILAAATYDGAYAPAMESFLAKLRMKSLQGRRIALIENGTWAPMAAKQMRAALEGLKNTEVLEQQVTVRSAITESNRAEIAALVQALYAE